ncbi:MAG TPA: hypothetical protein H9894_05445 [Candidatus Desulfovibrio intestinipullorum]|uniref:Uncharacterized protein n=1 Tax=Candidatus Desulfovibrio intestinipullorum TaxID=2838536 RepID=A0A9D1TPQ0_9BACT|nr:hypothetical protein [Candidatus Desulfovibrio intestinipullorum]
MIRNRTDQSDETRTSLFVPPASGTAADPVTSRAQEWADDTAAGTAEDTVQDRAAEAVTRPVQDQMQDQHQEQDLLPREHTVAAPEPGSRRGKVLVLATLSCLMLALAGGLYWFWQFPQEFALLADRKGNETQARLRPVSPSANQPENRAGHKTGTQAATQAAIPGGQAEPAEPARSAGPAQQDEVKQAHAPAPDDAGSDEPAASVQLPALAGFAPGSVYSGTLGEMTRLQAGSQMARADLALKEVQVRLHELEARLQPEPLKETRAQQSELATMQQSLQKSMDRILTALTARSEEKADDIAGSLAVVAVRSQGGHLEAELKGTPGTFWVREGETVQGLRVDEISRQRVRLNGQTLPWR